MQLISDTIEILTDQNSSIESALLKAQVLAHRLGDSELSRWVECELRGYPNDVEIPPYRVLEVSLRGNITNGFYQHLDNVLPVAHLQSALRKRLTQNEVRDSIPSVEKMSQSESIAISIAAELLQVLSEPLSSGYYVQQAWGKFGIGALNQLLTQVRSRLLEFCLKLSDQISEELPVEEFRKRADEIKAHDIFRGAVFGDNTTIVVGSGSISGVKNKVIHNDLDSLFTHLRNHGIVDNDIDGLNSAIQADSSSEDVINGKFGPRVSKWIGDMISKAESAAWEISIASASTILVAAISSYYGIGGS